jgi:hypothetical protein
VAIGRSTEGRRRAVSGNRGHGSGVIPDDAHPSVRVGPAARRRSAFFPIGIDEPVQTT